MGKDKSKKNILFKKEYNKMIPVWLFLQDAYDGERAIKEHDLVVFKTQKNCFEQTDNIFNYYLPPLPGMLTDDRSNMLYYSYLSYGMWYNAYGKTIDTYTELLTSKNIDMELPKQLSVESFLFLIKDSLREISIKNRCGLLVDAPVIPEELREKEITIQDTVNKELFPTFNLYPAEAIINWNDDNTYVVLHEMIEETVKIDDYMLQEKIEQFRILDIDNFGLYRQRVFRKIINDEGKEELKITLDINPIINGKYLDWIPFYPLTNKGITWELLNSFTEAIANVNKAHFRNSASYERALVLTGNPTTVIKGLLTYEDIDTKKGRPPKRIKLGSAGVLRVRTDGDAKYLEYSGSGVEPIRKAMLDKEALLARLGADVIETGKQGVESAEALTIKSKGENSLLASLAITLSQAYTKILTDIYGEGYKVSLNKDFNLEKMSSSDLGAIGIELGSGHISWETYFYNLQRGEIIPPGVTAEQEEKKILLDQDRDTGVVEEVGNENENGEINKPTNQVQLNGAQVDSAMNIVKSVQIGELSKKTAIEILQILFNMDLTTAERMLIGVGEGKNDA